MLHISIHPNLVQGSLVKYPCQCFFALSVQAVEAKKADKKTDIVADTKVEDLPLKSMRGDDDDDEEGEKDILPAEEEWEREHLISTKRGFPPLESREDS